MRSLPSTRALATISSRWSPASSRSPVRIWTVASSPISQEDHSTEPLGPQGVALTEAVAAAKAARGPVRPPRAGRPSRSGCATASSARSSRPCRGRARSDPPALDQAPGRAGQPDRVVVPQRQPSRASTRARGSSGRARRTSAGRAARLAASRPCRAGGQQPRTERAQRVEQLSSLPDSRASSTTCTGSLGGRTQAADLGRQASRRPGLHDPPESCWPPLCLRGLAPWLPRPDGPCGPSLCSVCSETGRSATTDVI